MSTSLSLNATAGDSYFSSKSKNELIDWDDFDRYENELKQFLDGSLDPHHFLHSRLNLGVYTQRQEGQCMVRAKLPGGVLNAQVLEGIAYCLEDYSLVDEVQITTRQDIQFHYIPLEQTANMQRDLARFEIATREAGGNTVRNITACQLSGHCPSQYVDIQAYIDVCAKYFVRHPLTQSLPRKFKMSFSACEQDCAGGQVHDLGIIASKQHGKIGFKLLVGGGLGAKPKKAQCVAEFIPEAELLPAIEAILLIHDKHSDRARRTRNRIKFLVENWGIKELKANFEKHFERTRQAFNRSPQALTLWNESIDNKAEQESQPWGESFLKPQEQLISLASLSPKAQKANEDKPIHVSVHVPSGSLNKKQLDGLASLLKHYPELKLKTNQNQGLSLFNIHRENYQAIQEHLKLLDLHSNSNQSDIIACPGTTTCPLGITNSQKIAKVLQANLSNEGLSELAAKLSIRINGCQNNCANSTTADIGFIGKAVRHHGQLIPSYKLQLGGSSRLGQELAFSGPHIPAMRLPSALKRIIRAYEEDKLDGESFYHWSRKKPAAYFEELLASLCQVGESQAPFLVRDLGDNQVFQVKSVGMGECAGAQIAEPSKRLLEAQYERDLSQAFSQKFKYEEAIEAFNNYLNLLTQLIFNLEEKEGAQSEHKGDSNWYDSIIYLEALGYEIKAETLSLATLYPKLKDFAKQPDEQQFPSFLSLVKGLEDKLIQKHPKLG